MLFIIDSLFCTLLTHFEPLYTNMYLIGPSYDAVLRYKLRLEVYGATFVREGSEELRDYILTERAIRVTSWVGLQFVGLGVKIQRMRG